jgi:hypothetical protein
MIVQAAGSSALGPITRPQSTSLGLFAKHIDVRLSAPSQAEISGLNRDPSFRFVVNVEPPSDLNYPAVVKANLSVVQAVLPFPYQGDPSALEVTC